MSSTGGGRYNEYSQGSSGWSIMRNEEFQEHDIWGVRYEIKEEEINSHFISNTTNSRQQSTSAKIIIPKSSISSPGNEHKCFQQSSAPINIPHHWQKISSNDFLCGGSRDGGGGGGGDDIFLMNNNNSWDSDDEDEDEDERMIPPHEWISRKVARSQICTFSVYEGVGRTLKGRDLSNVRNAVLTKTGFLE